MADNPLSQDAMMRDPAALRRRARRRLVGAVAIALTAVVVVPMLFDPEPKPLGSAVDIRIPDQNTPFEPEPVAPVAQTAAPESTAPEVPPQAAEPTPQSAKPVPAEAAPGTPPKTVATELPREAKKALAKPDQEAKKAAPSPAKPVPAKPEPAFASRGYYLQLGAFSSEANAKGLLQKVEAAGFKVGMTDANHQYRVRVGPITERDKALEMQNRLREKGFSPVIIGP